MYQYKVLTKECNNMEKEKITVSFICDSELYEAYKVVLRGELDNEYGRINVAADIKRYFRSRIEAAKEKEQDGTHGE